MNPHEILGVREGASLDEIKAAYREQARRHHPDMGGDAWVFRQIEWAYSVLTSEAPGSPKQQHTDSQPPSGADSHVRTTSQDGFNIHFALGVILVVGMVWWFGWLGIFRLGLWLGLAASSGASLYCACSAWTTASDRAARRKYLLLSVTLASIAGVAFTVLALTIVNTSARRLNKPSLVLAAAGPFSTSTHKVTTWTARLPSFAPPVGSH